MAITSISGIHLRQNYSNSRVNVLRKRTVGKCIFKSIRYLHAPKSNKQHQSLIGIDNNTLLIPVLGTKLPLVYWEKNQYLQSD